MYVHTYIRNSPTVFSYSLSLSILWYMYFLQIVAAGGNPYTHRLPARPKTPVFREAQKHVRARLEKKWMALFIKTPEYITRNGQSLPEGQSREAFDGAGQVVTVSPSQIGRASCRERV